MNICQRLYRLDRLANCGKFNGIVSIYKNLDMYYETKTNHAFGDISNKDHFLTGNVTLQMLSVIILRYVEKKIVDLNVPIHIYLPKYKYIPWTHIVTLLDLLSHKSGIYCTSAHSKIRNFQFENYGTFKYANENYKIAGKIITTMTGKTLRQLYEELFSDANMYSSFIFNGESINLINDTYNTNIKKGYVFVPFTHHLLFNLVLNNYNYNIGLNRIDNSLTDGPQYIYPECSNVISTIQDLHQWNHHLYNSDLFYNENTFAIFSKSNAIQSNAIQSNKIQSNNYGLGILKTCDNPLEFSHTGWVYGFQITVVYYPDKNYSVVIVENVSRFGTLSVPHTDFSVHNLMIDVIRHHIKEI